jgi:hypothetical protein
VTPRDECPLSFLGGFVKHQPPDPGRAQVAQRLGVDTGQRTTTRSHPSACATKRSRSPAHAADMKQGMIAEPHLLDGQCVRVSLHRHAPQSRSGYRTG